MMDVIIVFAVTALLVVLVVSIPRRSQPRTARLTCVSNLKQVGLAFRMWANDNDGQFPFAVASTNDGTREWIEQGEVWRHFSALIKELNTPKVLACPSDPDRPRAVTWEEFTSNARLSYFVGFDASETRPRSILSGDRNISGPVDTRTRIMQLTTNSAVAWNRQTHDGYGNLGFGDGGASQFTSEGLRSSVASAAPPSGQPMRIGVP